MAISRRSNRSLAKAPAPSSLRRGQLSKLVYAPRIVEAISCQSAFRRRVAFKLVLDTTVPIRCPGDPLNKSGASMR